MSSQKVNIRREEGRKPIQEKYSQRIAKQKILVSQHSTSILLTKLKKRKKEKKKKDPLIVNEL